MLEELAWGDIYIYHHPPEHGGATAIKRALLSDTNEVEPSPVTRGRGSTRPSTEGHLVPPLGTTKKFSLLVEDWMALRSGNRTNIWISFFPLASVSSHPSISFCLASSVPTPRCCGRRLPWAVPSLPLLPLIIIIFSLYIWQHPFSHPIHSGTTQSSRLAGQG